MTLLAYAASDGESGAVFFAETAEQALDRAGDYLDYSCTTVARAPQFDCFADQRYVPTLALLENDWWLECWGCERQVSKDAMFDSLYDWDFAIDHSLFLPEEPPVNIILVGEKVFCCSDCAMQYEATQAAWRAKKEQAFAQARAKFPGLTVAEYWPQSTLEAPALLVMQLPHLPSYLGKFSWFAGSNKIQIGEDALPVYKSWERMVRLALPAPRGES